jgi:hypothetical protein
MDRAWQLGASNPTAYLGGPTGHAKARGRPRELREDAAQEQNRLRSSHSPGACFDRLVEARTIEDLAFEFVTGPSSGVAIGRDFQVTTRRMRVRRPCEQRKMQRGQRIRTRGCVNICSMARGGFRVFDDSDCAGLYWAVGRVEPIVRGHSEIHSTTPERWVLAILRNPRARFGTGGKVMRVPEAVGAGRRTRRFPGAHA